jgi:hypothetical protein
MVVSPPIRFRIEWADSQGKVTASWLAAHFNFERFPPALASHLPTFRVQPASSTHTLAAEN